MAARTIRAAIVGNHFQPLPALHVLCERVMTFVLFLSRIAQKIRAASAACIGKDIAEWDTVFTVGFADLATCNSALPLRMGWQYDKGLFDCNRERST
ncbi:hypothetical protein CA54_21090 [Symmachiella macrocystis]|uniref:Uncharacterized protein n=1 Tax=Symmachiella macrocystis TaxID=2527985 RepID=A0A5C6BPX7_9PLAN|nr:hypothetical protein CA54_21090 [Symmachiella macrocystis]